MSFNKSLVFLVVLGGAVDFDRGLRPGMSSILLVLSSSYTDYPYGLAPANINFALAIASGSPVPVAVADTVLGCRDKLEPALLGRF